MYIGFWRSFSAVKVHSGQSVLWLPEDVIFLKLVTRSGKYIRKSANRQFICYSYTALFPRRRMVQLTQQDGHWHT